MEVNSLWKDGEIPTHETAVRDDSREPIFRHEASQSTNKVWREGGCRIG